jgi:hypothetical protein
LFDRAYPPSKQKQIFCCHCTIFWYHLLYGIISGHGFVCKQ